MEVILYLKAFNGVSRAVLKKQPRLLRVKWIWICIDMHTSPDSKQEVALITKVLPHPSPVRSEQDADLR